MYYTFRCIKLVVTFVDAYKEHLQSEICTHACICTAWRRHSNILLKHVSKFQHSLSIVHVHKALNKYKWEYTLLIIWCITNVLSPEILIPSSCGVTRTFYSETILFFIVPVLRQFWVTQKYMRGFFQCITIQYWKIQDCIYVK